MTSPGDVAHVLRRTTFGPLPGQVARFASASDAIEWSLTVPALPELRPPVLDRDDNDATDSLALAWLQAMRSPDAGIHEKMTWFWHGHLTSSIEKTTAPAMAQQHRLLRRHAMGNFRQLVQELTVDPAMLQYLNGDGSVSGSPNENYGRELMELFTMGRGNYTEADVRAAARGLSGWSVDKSTATFSEASANQISVSFLGREGRLRATDIVSTVCDHPSCAPFIVGRLHRYLVGTDPDPTTRDRLATLFRGQGLEIRPVVEAIVRDPSFLAARRNRARYPVEWLTMASACLNIDPDVAQAYNLGQVPFHPTNVAGWPVSDRWLSSSAMVARLSLVTGAGPVEEVRQASDPVAAALERAALSDVGEPTSQLIHTAARAVPDPAARAQLLMALVLTCPEALLA